MEKLEFKNMKEQIADNFKQINESAQYEKYDIAKIEKFLDKHEESIIKLDDALNLGEAYDYDTKRIKKRELKDILEDFINNIKNNNNEIGYILDTIMLENVINYIFNYLLHTNIKQYGYDVHSDFYNRHYERYNFVTYSYISTWLYNNRYCHFYK